MRLPRPSPVNPARNTYYLSTVPTLGLPVPHLAVFLASLSRGGAYLGSRLIYKNVKDRPPKLPVVEVPLP